MIQRLSDVRSVNVELRFATQTLSKRWNSLIAEDTSDIKDKILDMSACVQRGIKIASLLIALVTAARADNTPLEQAKSALQRAQWKEAERLIRVYLTAHQSEAEAHYMLAYALFRENLPGESLSEYRHAARLQKPDAVELRWVALDYVLLKDYKDADTWMTKSVSWDPKDGESWYSLGRIQYQENYFNKAETSFRTALRLMPGSAKVENNLGLTCEALNRSDEALAAYKQAIAWQADERDPSEQPFLNLGSLLIDRGQLDDALAPLQKAVLIAPADSKIHAALGKLYTRRGDFDQARKELLNAIDLDPHTASLHFQLGVVYRKQGDTKNAKAEFAQAAQLDGTHSSDGENK